MKNKFSKFNGYAKWISISIVVAIIIYNAISNTAIRQNELKHILENQNKIMQRIERIEDFLWIK